MHTFVVLAHNEAPNLPRLLASLDQTATTLGGPAELILVDDGSTDATVATARQCSIHMPLFVERHGSNLGVAQGFMTGFRSALAKAKSGDVIITLEADNTADLGVLKEMEEKILRGADVVLASCYARGGGVRGVPLGRKVMSVAINIVMRILFPIRGCHTYSSFYRVYRSDIIKRAFDYYGNSFIEARGFTVAAEILLKLRRLGAVVDEVPMILEFGERQGRSKMKVWKTIWEYIAFLGRESRAELVEWTRRRR